MNPCRSRRQTARRSAGGALALTALLALPLAGWAQEPPRAGAEPDEGRRISEYDFAVSHAMRALMEAGTEPQGVTLYVARKERELWHVYFGSFDFRGPRFDLAYEVVQEGPGSADFAVRRFLETQPADAELTRAAMALVTALDAFEPRSVRFYTYVWRDEAGRWVTYFVPEAVAPGAVRRTADQRVVVSPDARRVLESRFAALGADPAAELWMRADPPERPGALDFVQILLAPQYAPFTFITRRLVCEMSWDGRIERCLVGGGS